MEKFQLKNLINPKIFHKAMQPLIKKYTPKSTSEILGQDEAINQLKDFVVNFKKQKKKAALLYGPSGCGKTASVCAIANELGLELLEINASDYRNKEQIDQRVGSATQQMSLFFRGKLILVDEIDGLSGTKDRGGASEIANLIQKSAFPILMTANNPWDNKFSSLRKKTVMVQFNPLETESIYKVLKNICDKEGIRYEESALKALALRSAGDLRGSIIDLQTISLVNKTLDRSSLDELGDRNKVESVLNALLKIFKTTDPKIAIESFDNVQEDLDQCFLWVDENLPHEYTKQADLARAYDHLSRADVFRGRIKRWQHWRFLVYQNALLSAGVAVSKDEKYKKFVQYKPTGRILKLWWAKQKNMKKKEIAGKIAKRTHTSTKQIMKDFEYFRQIFKNNKEMANQLTDELELDKEEIDWLRK